MTEEQENKLKVRCLCGWNGTVDELTAEDDEESLRCPRCKTVGWWFE